MSASRVIRKRARSAALLAALLFCGIGGLTGCASSAYEERVARDEQLSRTANLALEAAGVDTQRIEARSYLGVVALLGSADETEVAVARRVVSGLPGVVRVNNLVLTESTSNASGFARAGVRKAPMIARGASAPDPK